jgi:hypothetical protein
MFVDSSRYANVKTVDAETEDGRTVTAVALRRLPYVAGTPTLVTGADRLDVMAQRKYGDGARFWHIADANTALEANDLLKPRSHDKEARVIEVPET